MRRILLFLIPLAILALPSIAISEPAYTYKDRAEFDTIFDEIARNFGAVEAAYYTFTLEYEGTPANIQEMIETGHLRVRWKNPYTGEPVRQTYSKEPGEISWELWADGEYISTSTFYVDYHDNSNTRWMTKVIWPYTNREFRDAIFSDDVTREEQLVRVYCLQLEDALDSYIQRFGELPDDYEELKKGDYNVLYINPITGEPVENSSELSPGDFWYKKLGKKLFYIVGWGEKEPVYFLSNDRTIDEFTWENEGDSGSTDIVNSGLSH